MTTKREGGIPNSTQVPNLVLDEWMPRLSDVELRVLLVVIRQTLGWEEDAETGRRKDRDWMSQTQLIEKTGRSRKHISKAVKQLVEVHSVLETCDEKGRLLNTALKRKRNGAKIFYRYTWKGPAATLFDVTLVKALKSEKTKGRTSEIDETKGLMTKGRTTKETPTPTKVNTLRQEPLVLITQPRAAGKVAHQRFMEFWWAAVRRVRAIQPIINAKDGAALKRILALGIEEQVLEQVALFFLADPGLRKFSPTIATLTSAGILNGLLNRTVNDPEFHRTLDRYVGAYMSPGGAIPAVHSNQDIQTALKALGAKFSAPVASYA